jgi:hypothetical protein
MNDDDGMFPYEHLRFKPMPYVSYLHDGSLDDSYLIEEDVNEIAHLVRRVCVENSISLRFHKGEKNETLYFMWEASAFMGGVYLTFTLGVYEQEENKYLKIMRTLGDRYRFSEFMSDVLCPKLGLPCHHKLRSSPPPIPGSEQDEDQLVQGVMDFISKRMVESTAKSKKEGLHIFCSFVEDHPTLVVRQAMKRETETYFLPWVIHLIDTCDSTGYHLVDDDTVLLLQASVKFLWRSFGGDLDPKNVGLKFVEFSVRNVGACVYHVRREALLTLVEVASTHPSLLLGQLQVASLEENMPLYELDATALTAARHLLSSLV